MKHGKENEKMLVHLEWKEKMAYFEEIRYDERR
jgi:hypothetical protein